MECPHCGYKHGWDGDLCDTVKGYSGDFYRVSNVIRMERDSDDSTRDLIGCPDCNKIFME